MAARRPIDLSQGGVSWAGWRLAPYGRARDWRLQAPNGEIFEALELLELRALRLDVDWLRLRVRQLEARAGGAACHFTDAEHALLTEAAALLARVLPAAPRRRRPGFSAVTTAPRSTVTVADPALPQSQRGETMQKFERPHM